MSDSIASVPEVRRVNSYKRVFGYLVDAILVAFLSLLAGALTHMAFASSLINIVGIFLRDGVTPKGSLGKRLAGLEIESLSEKNVFRRFGISVLRNTPFGLPLLLFTIYPSPDEVEQLLFTLLFLTILAIELWRIRVANGVRFGDILAGDRVVDLKPQESKSRYIWLILGAVMVAALIQIVAAQVFLPFPDSSH
jgi:hypothetical protein